MHVIVATVLAIIVFTIVGFCTLMSPAWLMFRKDQILIVAAILTTLLYVLFADVWMAVKVALLVWLITVWVLGHLLDQVEEAII